MNQTQLGSAAVEIREGGREAAEDTPSLRPEHAQANPKALGVMSMSGGRAGTAERTPPLASCCYVPGPVFPRWLRAVGVSPVDQQGLGKSWFG